MHELVQSWGAAHAAEPPATPTKLQWLRKATRTDLNDALRRLGVESGITFPSPRRESPSKRPKSPAHQVVYRFTDLFYLNRPRLVQEIQTFLDYANVYANREEKIEFLSRRLTEAIKECSLTTPQFRHMPRPNQDILMSEPPSPTLSAMHAPKTTIEDIGELRLQPQASSARIDSKNTSFATTMSAVFSEPQENSQGPPSPATTLYDSTQDLVSSWGECTITALHSKLAAPADLGAMSSEMLIDGAVEPATQDYGSPPASSALIAIAEAQAPPTMEIQAPITTIAQAEAPAATVAETQAPTRTTRASASQYAQVQRIATDGLTSIHLPHSFHELPLDLRAESHRVLQSSTELSPEKLEQLWVPRSFETLHKIAEEYCPNFRKGFATSYEGYSLCAKLQWYNPMKERSLHFELQPPQKQPPNGYQRKFESSRFLFVEAVSLLEPPKALGLGSQAEHVRQRVLEMLATEQEFLGSTWLLFHVAQKTRRKPGEPKQSGTFQLIFFALRGPDLFPLGLQPLWDWAIHLKENTSKLWCKAAARTDLQASRPLTTIELSENDIMDVDDAHATPDLADTRYNDPDPKFDFHEDYDPDVVMNDGCSEADESLFIEVSEKLQLDQVPSAMQFRCRGAKGMIFMRRPAISEDGGDDEPQSQRPRMEITPSQSKVKVKHGFDRHTFALNIVAVSHSLTSSYLYSDFLPILVDRHVPAEVIENYAEMQAQQDADSLLKAFESPRSLREWLYREKASRENFRREQGIETVAGFPIELEEKIVQMTESGFEATKFKPLAEPVQIMIDQYVKEQKKTCKIRIGRSTLAYGVVDPTGTLEPGEIQVNFSKRFQDPDSPKSWSHLSGPVLVTRNPAAWPSDMQKVRAVFRPQLSHLVDVVIFSAKGRRPLAGKCSGGDHDGDTFWICWESSFVKPFQNAPAPLIVPSPESFGIEVDTRTLGEVIQDPSSEDQVRLLVQRFTANRLTQNLLGFVTKTREKVVYKENSLVSETIKDLTNVKDLIMDSDKNGRWFPDAAWTEFKKARGIYVLPMPEYSKVGTENESSLNLAMAKRENILDNVYCFIVYRIVNAAHEKVTQMLNGAALRDEHLPQFYDRMLTSVENNPVAHAELVALPQKLAAVNKAWGEKTGQRAKAKRSLNPIPWIKAAEATRPVFDGIRPSNEDHDTVVEWIRQSGDNPTTWDKLKASALVKKYSHGQLPFNIVGKELCILKMEAMGMPTRTMMAESYEWLKYRKRKRDEYEGSKDDMYDDVNVDVDFDDDESWTVAMELF